MRTQDSEQRAAAVTSLPAGRPLTSMAERAGLLALATGVLFFCYWRQSLSAALSSDGSGNVLQAWAMLHGNVLLHGWRVSDVSFYTTELPQYVLIEAVRGAASPAVVHVAAAMTYTLLVLLAALLARGRARGRVGMARAALTAGLMLSPQLSATGIVLLSPDHTGTAVPLLVTWLLIDSAPRFTGGLPPPVLPGDPLGGPSRVRLWLVPMLAGVLFLWTMVADTVVLLSGIIPLVVVALVRSVPGLSRNRGAVRAYELGLAGAAAAAGVAGLFAPRVIAALGGFRESPVPEALALGQLQHGSWVTLQAFLELFGANVFGFSYFGAAPVIEVVFVALHLAGVLAVVCAVGLAFRRFFRPGELMTGVFAVAVMANAVAYMVSDQSRNLLGAREMAAVLPLGAVLAGRILGEKIAAWMPPAARQARRGPWPAMALATLAVLAAADLAGLGYRAAQPAVPPANQALATWLQAHRLRSGLASYWQASSTTADSGLRVQVSAVTPGPDGRLVPYEWETDDAAYNPARHYANFVVAAGTPTDPIPAAAIATFGRPQRTYRGGGYLVMVWNTNLMPKLGRPGPS
jgi:hypothetical protein